MADSVLMTKKLIKSDVDANNNKFWIARLYSDFSVFVHWGRIGTTGANQTKSFNSQYSAKDFIDRKTREKRNKGYSEIETIDEIITDTSIQEARKLLNEISEFVEKKDFDSYRFRDILNKYLMLIPQKVQSKLNSKTLFADGSDIKKQNDILDALDNGGSQKIDSID